ncbi:hypothetical protein ASE47_30690 [Ensifer sp. Root258]|nr:hypothetical protein ASE47_30690 [Ensifer sp. Root258]
MDLDATAVDEQSIRRIIGPCERTEDAFPDAAFGPADEAVVECLLRSIDICAIRPAATTAQRMDDPAQDPAVIHARLASHICRQKRLYPLPLRVGKPKEIRHATASSLRRVNHVAVRKETHLLGPDPSRLALTIAPSFGAAIALRMFGGVASAALIPTAFALVSDIVPAHRQSAAMGVVMIGMTFGIVAGPVFAGILTDAFDWRAPFHVTATGYLVAFIIAQRVIPSQLSRRPAKKPKRLAWIVRGSITRPLFAKGLWNGTAVAGFLLAGEVLRLRHGLSVGAVGVSVSAFGLGLAIGNLGIGPVSRLCRKDDVTLVVALALLILAVSTFMLAPLPLTGGLVCLVIWGFALGLAAPASTSMLATRSDADKGQVLAVSESLNNLAILVVLPIAATQLEVAGTASAMIVLGISLAASLALTMVDRRFLRLQGS